MDVSAFSDENFDVKDWINKTFKSTENPEIKQVFATVMVTKLQLYVQQINGALEETSQSVLSSLPRILRDTHLLQQEATALQDKMVVVKQEIANVEKDTASSIAVLERIDRIKTDLQTAKQGLHEADNWTVLANDVEEVFESGDIENIASKLFSMQKSLTMLANVVDYEDKKLQLEGLKNRLEAMASPRLVEAFTASNAEQSKIYVNIFNKIDRLPQLLKYYHNCLKVSLSQEWRRTIELAQDENITYWLHTFYDKLLSVWQEQLKWCTQVFKNFSVEVLIEVYTDLLRNLDPGILECIEATLKQHTNAMQLTLLMELKQITRHFTVNLQGAIEISQNKIQEQKMLHLAQAIYMPYVPYVTKYSIYENAQLGQQLNSLDCIHDDLSETINYLSLSISRILDYANEANKRCKIFTEGCGYPGLLKSLNGYFNNYVEKYRTGIRMLEKRKVKHEDWNLFQMCLTLMQTIGEFLGNVENFEKTLTMDIIEINNKIQNSSTNVFGQYKILLLTAAGRTDLQNIVSSIQREDKTVLDPTIKAIHKLCADLHRTTYEVIFSPIFTQLLLVQKAPAWSMTENSGSSITSDLPDYSFAPQEYITQIGQYLMTLPQHLEPFLLRDNPSLTHALKAADVQYNQGSTESGFADILLGIVAKETCQMFQDQTLGICELNFAACKQLATDIDYLGNVLEELGLSLSENLQQMSQLLRLTPEDYQSGTSGCNARVVAAVRQMRNITSSGD
ncbi:conserved oligomeric Golgi complex subunit 7 isoform X2 [Leptopilina heterotoma]|uniref:conserved oligomeric Golgi complex subunit 7 isoform X2 n=1 Tax=Leptopilina heterotoma TaxID=63436 RepID=UPI001CA8840C|nr:conserved oligomeric Golgi complex subunit 7 isoform X2 [Leptopilina heterotoma]